MATNRSSRIARLTICVLLGSSGTASAAVASQSADLPPGKDQSGCLLAALAAAAPDTPVSAIRALCPPPPASASDIAEPGVAEPEVAESEVAESEVAEPEVAEPDIAESDTLATYTGLIAAEQQSLDRSYSLTPHMPNYLLVWSHNDNPNRTADGDALAKHQEAVLQVSVKFPLWRRILGTDNDLMFSYSARSWFQAYNKAESKPFRETNYEPEFFLRHYTPQRFGPLQIAGWDIGYVHQSNGRREPASRSWDRLMGRMAVDLRNNLSLAVRAWYRFPESESSDDNPDIYRYLGYGDIRGIWTPNLNTFTAMWRPGTDKHSFELTWSYPLNNHFRIYTQYFNGYGESLIDYNRRIERIGIGFAINDFLQTEEK